MSVTGAIYASTTEKSPRIKKPINMSSVFQMKVPQSDKIKKSFTGIRTEPAGIEITERTPGMKRPANTAVRSKRVNVRTAN